MRRIAVVALAVAAASCAGPERVVVAAGTTLVDSGVLSVVVADYEAATGDHISVVADSTLRVLDLGRRGAAEVLITHNPEAEAEFVAGGLTVDRRPFAVSRFLLVGPPGRAAELDGATPAEAFAAIAAEEWPFVARADGSGTATAEAAVWVSAGVEPSGDWYRTTGLGMGETLQVADQRDAFTLAEEGTFAAASGVIGLVAVSLTGEALHNPYHAMLTAAAGPDARRFFDWLTSAEGRASLASANEEIFGRQVFSGP